MKRTIAIILTCIWVTPSAAQTSTYEQYREWQRRAAEEPCVSEEDCRAKKELRNYNLMYDKFIEPLSEEKRKSLSCSHFSGDCARQGTKTNGRKQPMPTFDRMPDDAKEKMNDVVESCNEMGLDITEPDDSLVLLGGSERENSLILFQPSYICGRNRGGACSTDGCNIYVYFEQGRVGWSKVLDISEVGLQWLAEQKGKPAQLVLTVRGGTPWCAKGRSDQCTHLLTWQGAGFDRKRLR